MSAPSRWVDAPLNIEMACSVFFFSSSPYESIPRTGQGLREFEDGSNVILIGLACSACTVPTSGASGGSGRASNEDGWPCWLRNDVRMVFYHSHTHTETLCRNLPWEFLLEQWSRGSVGTAVATTQTRIGFYRDRIQSGIIFL